MGGKTKKGGGQNLKKGGKLGQGVGALKMGNWNPLTNYGYSCIYRNYYKLFFQDVTRLSMSTVSFLTQLDSGILCL